MKLAALLTVFLLALSSPSQAPTAAEKNAPSRITIPTKQEPGERMIVTGVVFDADEKTPLAGASVYVYHTDANGLYTPGAAPRTSQCGSKPKRL
jgi:protocatechuate 3,4-dioxygenase beta subunit